MPEEKNEKRLRADLFLDHFKELGEKLSQATKLINEVHTDLRSMWFICTTIKKED